MTATGNPTHDSAVASVTGTDDKTFKASGLTANPSSPGTWELDPNDSSENAAFTISGSGLKASTEYTVEVTLADGVGGSKLTVDTSNNPNSKASKAICTGWLFLFYSYRVKKFVMVDRASF